MLRAKRRDEDERKNDVERGDEDRGNRQWREEIETREVRGGERETESVGGREKQSEKEREKEEDISGETNRRMKTDIKKICQKIESLQSKLKDPYKNN